MAQGFGRGLLTPQMIPFAMILVQQISKRGSLMLKTFIKHLYFEVLPIKSNDNGIVDSYGISEIIQCYLY